jgi:hypothetical protein
VGWFDWLKSAPATNVDAQPDAIWVSIDAKLKGIRDEIEEASGREVPPACIYVVAYFNDWFQRLEELVAAIYSKRPLRVCLAKAFADEVRLGPAPEAGQGIEIIAAEHHPHPKHDEAILRAAEELPYPCRLTYHISLDDALLRVFNSRSVADLLRRLGMKEDESIRSKMVTRRLKEAQKKIAESTIGDQSAESAVEWLGLNAPSAFERLL